MPLFDFQDDLKKDAYVRRAEGNVLIQLATGGGKTHIKASIAEDHNDYGCALAHRRELVGQISMAMATYGVRHRIIAPPNVVRALARRQSDELGRSFVYPNAKFAVAGVDSLRTPTPEFRNFGKKCGLWLQDECHHVLRENKWGRALELFPNAWGVGVTATPVRADGKGLGSHAHGVFSSMVLGPPVRWLMDNNRLSNYRIVMAAAELENLKVGASGEYTADSVDQAVYKSKLIGKIVPTWEQFGAGRKTVVFAHNLKAAADIVAEFKAAGYSARVVDGGSNDGERTGALRDFKNGSLDVLVNVDLFGEGFDLPEIECVILARPTSSLGLYLQQIGRVLRWVLNKDYGLIIDHVGNVSNPHHGLPDRPRIWTLDARERRPGNGPSDLVPTRTCGNPICRAPYERIFKDCPYCGWVWTPAECRTIEQVDGDFVMLDPSMLRELQDDADRIKMTPAQVAGEMRGKTYNPLHIGAATKNHVAWVEMQTALRATIEQWCGYRKAEGHADRTINRIFYFRFGIDILSAYKAPVAEAKKILIMVYSSL